MARAARDCRAPPHTRPAAPAETLEVFHPPMSPLSTRVSLSAAAFALLLVAAADTSAQTAASRTDLPKLRQVSERLFRGAQPRAGGLRRLPSLGVQTVINLRGASARTRADETEARALGLRYFNLPLPTWGRPPDARMRLILDIIAAPESGRVFIHCKDGVDRTGTVVALHRMAHEGWAAGDALAEADRLGMRKVQYWMRDYVADYGRRLGGPGAAEAHAGEAVDEDFGDRLGGGVRVAERGAFRARKVGGRVLRRTLGGFVGGLF